MNSALELVSRPQQGPLGNDPKIPRVVEVGQIWSGTLMDVRHLGADCSDLLLGDAVRSPLPAASAAGLAPLALGCIVGLATSSAAAATSVAGISILGYSSGLLFDETRRLQRPQSFLVDHSLLPCPRFRLVQRRGGVTYIHFTGSFHGYIEDARGRRSLADLTRSGEAVATAHGHRVELADGARGIVQVGPHTFAIREVPAARRVMAGMGIDTTFMGLFLLIAFLGLVLGLVIQSVPYDPDHDLVQVPERMVEAIYMPQPEPPPEKRVVTGNNPDAGEGKRAKGEEGKVGKEEYRLKHARGTRVAQSKAQLDKTMAESSGLLADLQRMESNNNMFGDGGLSVGRSAFVGGVLGSQYGNQYGSGGLYSRGAGIGGGGDGEGLGGLGTRDRGGRGGSGYGHDGGYVGDHIGRVPAQVGMEAPILMGALDKSQIDRVIKQHLSQIRYCYQKELNRAPDLEGKVVMKFVIATDGSVSRADVQSTSLNNPVVESCLSDRFMRFQFPRPTGGGIVIVTYPFVFNRM